MRTTAVLTTVSNTFNSGSLLPCITQPSFPQGRDSRSRSQCSFSAPTSSASLEFPQGALYGAGVSQGKRESAAASSEHRQCCFLLPAQKSYLLFPVRSESLFQPVLPVSFLQELSCCTNRTSTFAFLPENTCSEFPSAC